MGLSEYGFWDYTAPGTGGMEHYGRDDYLSLLDDMAEAGMNSLVVIVKWMTTGYTSQLPWLDQELANPAVASDNRLIHLVLDEARRRGIKVWLGAVVTQFVTASYGESPHRHFEIYVEGQPRHTAIFDLDMPQVAERAVVLFEEIVELFPQAAGLIVEIEGGDVFAPHRVEPYNRWAHEHDKPAAMNGSCPAYPEYAAFRRWQVLRAVEEGVRAKGFNGDMATICEVINLNYNTIQVVDLAELARGFPGIGVVTYSYSRWQRRLAVADYCFVQPPEHGFPTFYLGRGVMTWNKQWRSPQPPMPMSLREQWAIDVEDVARYGPDGFWWFGSGAVREGSHVDLGELQELGFKDGRDARLQLIRCGERLTRQLARKSDRDEAAA